MTQEAIYSLPLRNTLWFARNFSCFSEIKIILIGQHFHGFWKYNLHWADYKYILCSLVACEHVAWRNRFRVVTRLCCSHPIARFSYPNQAVIIDSFSYIPGIIYPVYPFILFILNFDFFVHIVLSSPVIYFSFITMHAHT